MMDLDTKRPDATGDICNTVREAQSGLPEQAAVEASLHREILALIPTLRCYARALKPDFAAADDLVQECLCRALAKIHLWQRGTDLRAWLFTILHNQHVNEARRSMRQGFGIAVEDVASTLTIAADAPSLMQLRDLQRALDSLSAVQRQAILLVGLEGMKYQEAAVTLGIPASTLRSRLSRARERLRALMEGNTAISSSAAPRLCQRPHASASVMREARV